MRKDTLSTLLVLSAAIAMLLLASPLLPFSKPLLQPVQAQTAMTFGTPTPAISEEGGSLTFEAHGTNTSSDFKTAKITGGTFISKTGENGTIRNGNFNNNSGQNSLDLAVVLNNPPQDLFVISTSCSTSTFNLISVGGVPYRGSVECSTIGGGNAASSSMTGTAQDSDGDGIPDSSDRCTHNSNHRCFKEDTATHQEQQPSSSSSRTGNQTR